MDAKQIRAKIEKLRTELIQTRSEQRQELFRLLNEMYELELKLNPKYTIQQLAIDNEMSESSVYKTMSYRRATPYIKQMVESGQISMLKVIRILERLPKTDYDKSIKLIIEKNLTCDEIDKHIAGKKKVKQRIRTARKLQNIAELERDLKYYSYKLEVVLEDIHKVKNKKSVKEHIKKLQMALENALMKLG